MNIIVPAITGVVGKVIGDTTENYLNDYLNNLPYIFKKKNYDIYLDSVAQKLINQTDKKFHLNRPKKILKQVYIPSYINTVLDKNNKEFEMPIVVSPTQNMPKEYYFTLAHELGHYKTKDNIFSPKTKKQFDFLYKTLPQIGTYGAPLLLVPRNKYINMMAPVLPILAGLPRVINEYNASKVGYEMLKNTKQLTPEQLDKAKKYMNIGLGSYAASPLASSLASGAGLLWLLKKR